jgi:coenzyme Q-binding protein COQ10|tara:strand:+ start:232 stop:681 length:450 start_codon:yes stop_codon:yes gene_type:complete
MPQASVKRLIEADKQKLIELVLDIEKYKDFIPYCLDSKVYERNDKGDKIFIVADLTIGKGIFKDTYKSDVKYNKLNNTIYVTNIDGPLRYLENVWKFTEKDNITEVSFDVDFELKNKFLNILMTKSFNYGLNKIADAFQNRAEELFRNT